MNELNQDFGAFAEDFRSVDSDEHLQVNGGGSNYIGYSEYYGGPQFGYGYTKQMY